MSKWWPELGSHAWHRSHPGRYAIYYSPYSRDWTVRTIDRRVANTDTLPEAMDAAYADALTEAAAHFTIPPENSAARAIQEGT